MHFDFAYMKKSRVGTYSIYISSGGTDHPCRLCIRLKVRWGLAMDGHTCSGSLTKFRDAYDLSGRVFPLHCQKPGLQAIAVRLLGRVVNFGSWLKGKLSAAQRHIDTELEVKMLWKRGKVAQELANAHHYDAMQIVYIGVW